MERSGKDKAHTRTINKRERERGGGKKKKVNVYASFHHLQEEEC